MDSTPRPHGPDSVTPAPVPPGADTVPSEDDALLPPRAWLMRNGIYLIVFAALIGFVVVRYGLGLRCPHQRADAFTHARMVQQVVGDASGCVFARRPLHRVSLAGS